MKIVSVMTTGSRGGAEFAAVEMLDALSAAGHETVMVSNQPAIGRDTRVRVREVDLGPKLSKTSWRSMLWRWPLIVRSLLRTLDDEAPYDVLLLHYKKEQLLSLALPKRLLATTVWAEWGPVPFQLRKGIPGWLYRRAAKRAALIMAVSEGTKRSVCEVGVAADKVIVVPNVVRTDDIAFTEEGRTRVRAEHGIPADAFVVGCISRFHYKKRNDVVVKAVVALDDPSVHLILAGDGETEPELRAFGGPLGDRLHVIPTPGADVADVISAFDVSVFCPSPTEGAPRAVILGMLAERSCLSTGAEGVSDMIVPEIGAITSPENDVDALLPELRSRRDDAALRQREGKAARRIAEATYAAPVVAARIEQLFTAAGAGGAPGAAGAGGAPGAAART